MDGAGRAFVFGDDVDTDVLAPGHLMKLPAEDLATHCLESLAPEFASSVRPGDILVAGRNFGLGSSREQAAVSLRILGITTILAKSFGRIFYRNAFNIGIVALNFPEAHEVNSGDMLRVGPRTGLIENITRNTRYQVGPVPQRLLEMVEHGGLVPHLKRRLAAAKVSS